jgi:hypothetical protein
MAGMTLTSDLGRGAVLTLSEAAEACGVSRSTIKRRLSEFANAHQDGSGSWRVPVSDLLGAGLKLRPRPVTQSSESVTQGHDPAQNGAELAEARARIEALTVDLVAERTARQIAEVRATAYAANLDDLRLSLRAIGGPPRPLEPEQVFRSEQVESVPRRAAPEAVEPVPAPRGFRAWLRGRSGG